VAAHSEDSAILDVDVLIQCQSVTDGRTPRRRLRRVKQYMLSRVKTQPLN